MSKQELLKLKKLLAKLQLSLEFSSPLHPGYETVANASKIVEALLNTK